MEFIPAGELIGLAHQVRHINITQSPMVPDGDYKFIDMYCVDPECDCRKTIIYVYRNNIHVSAISFGWESPDYYQKWAGRRDDDQAGLEMSGASIDMNSPNRVSPKGMLDFFNALLNEEWIGKFKTHYAAVKKKVAKKKKKK